MPSDAASQTTCKLISQFSELHFKVDHWLLPTASAESMPQQLERISQLPDFDESPSFAEESARLLIVGHNPVFSAICTILQGGSSRHPQVLGPVSSFVLMSSFYPMAAVRSYILWSHETLYKTSGYSHYLLWADGRARATHQSCSCRRISGFVAREQ